MPRSRAKGNSKPAPAPVPLLDSLRAQSSNEVKNENECDLDQRKVSTSGWQCDETDWSDRNSSNRTPDVFPTTLRSVERKIEQTKNNFFPTTTSKASTIPNKKSPSDQIDVSNLTRIVSDLILGQCDQSAYTDFLSILQHYSVRTARDDHLEETVYHLIQSAVSFIRANKQRFDPLKLEECYRQRHLNKIESSQ